MEPQPLQDQMQFGIGCYIFEVENDAASNWAEEVTKTLGALPSVRDIEVDQPSSKPMQQSETGAHPAKAWLAFRINIPKRLIRRGCAMVASSQL